MKRAFKLIPCNKIVVAVLLGLLCIKAAHGDGLKLVSEALEADPAVASLTEAPVRLELELTIAQLKELQPVIGQFASHVATLAALRRELFQYAMGKSPKEQLARLKIVKEEAKALNGELRKQVFDVLTIKQQRRLNQLVLQHHLEQLNYESVFLILESEYDEKTVSTLDLARRKQLRLELRRISVVSQLEMITENFKLGTKQSVEDLVGDIFDKESGESIPLNFADYNEEDRASKNPRRQR